MENRSTTITDIEAEQPIAVIVALTKNCDRGLDQLFDSEVQSASRTDPQTEPNLQALESKSGLKQDCGLGVEKEATGSDAVTNLCVTSAKAGTEDSSSTLHPDATMPASLDCIRVLSSTNSMESERAASARSTRKASKQAKRKTSKQAKRFGFWVLSKIFV